MMHRAPVSALAASATAAPRTILHVQRDSSSKRQLDRGHSRLLLVAGLVLASYLMLTARLITVSVEHSGDSDSSSAITQEESPSSLPITALRGNIYDRHGELLATTLPSHALYARPHIIARFGTEEAVAGLHRIFPNLDKDTLAKRLSPERKFSYIEREITPAQMRDVNALGIPGLDFELTQRRFYPHGNLFSHILGYTDTDGKGIAAIEKQFDTKLGKEGDAITLSIDAQAQAILHDELNAAKEKFKALGAVGAILDLSNGEMIALSSLPDFDANHPGDSPANNLLNRAVSSVYEMGSTFKTFTTAMALNYGTAALYDKFDATKPIRIANHTIRDFHPEKRWLSVPEVFMHSSNIGTVRMIMEVGKERQQDFLRQLGLFEPVPLELPEVAAPLLPQTWRDVTMMTVSFGHGLSVTPMHLMQAMGSLLGNGKRLTPTLIKDGNKIANDEAQTLISPETVGQLHKLMRLVVEHGTAGKADAEGYRVGGKTGTSEKVKNGRYSKVDLVSSFVGIFPSEAPRFLIFALLDEPKGTKDTYGYATGGWVAAPVIKKVVERLAPHYNIRPVITLPEPPNSRNPMVHNASL